MLSQVEMHNILETHSGFLFIKTRLACISGCEDLDEYFTVGVGM